MTARRNPDHDHRPKFRRTHRNLNRPAAGPAGRELAAANTHDRSWSANLITVRSGARERLFGGPAVGCRKRRTISRPMRPYTELVSAGAGRQDALFMDSLSNPAPVAGISTSICAAAKSDDMNHRACLRRGAVERRSAALPAAAWPHSTAVSVASRSPPFGHGARCSAGFLRQDEPRQPHA
jgi:hypothetical protein